MWLWTKGYWNTKIKRNFLQNSLPGKGVGNLSDKHMAHGLLGHMTFINQGWGDSYNYGNCLPPESTTPQIK